MKKIDRNGETYTMKDGSLVEIINYKNAHDFDLKFEDGHIQHSTNFSHVKNGKIVNKNLPNKFGGYLGVGKYESNSPVYGIWVKMLERCYGDSNRFSITYDDCYVEASWLCFQNFAKWYEENHYDCSEGLQLDKDILVKDNNVYSAETCLLVPKTVNKLFVKQQTSRGDYPIGVSYSKKYNVLEVRCSNVLTNQKVFLGNFKPDNVSEAFTAYKVYKENLIKEVALLYQKQIPLKVFNAMLNYKIEITD